MMRLIWQLLRTYLLFSLVSVIAVISLAWVWWVDYQQQQIVYQRYVMQGKEMMSAYQMQRDHQAAQRLLSDAYTPFRDRGWVGHQSRLHWIDKIVALSRDVVIEDVRLRFSERAPLASGKVAGVSMIPNGVNTEVMVIEAFFMHEWDALKWIERLRKDVGMPLSLLASCQLKMMSHDAGIREDFPIFVSCRWLLFEVLEE